MGIAVSKASVALLLLRIVVKKWHIYLLWATIATTTLLCCITTTLLFLQCSPAAFLWDRDTDGGFCWLNFTDVALVMGGSFSWPISYKHCLTRYQHGQPPWTLSLLHYHGTL